MSYQTYTTEALVCGSHHSQTSDRSYLLFTASAGMLWASAKSVREEKSKQRYALQDFSLLRVSLVKGKSGWRIGSAEAIGNAFLAAEKREERAFVKNIVSLLRRYIHGQESLPQVFADVRCVFIEQAVPKDDVLQLVFTIRLLHALGYISETPAVTALLAPTLPEAYRAYTPEQTAALELLIQHAHHISHL
jgi:recombinational DNA repair protein (RecF pathway)